jgi:hypothetical protein
MSAALAGAAAWVAPEAAAYVDRRRGEGRPVAIDLGCGGHKGREAFGVDVAPARGVDLVHDLCRRPYRCPRTAPTKCC